MDKAGRVRVTYSKSAIGYSRDQKATVEALGLTKLHQTVEHADTPQIRGMIHKVQHLVTVAQCAVRASMAADLATRAVAAGGGAFEVAAARVIVDAAAAEGTRAAHQAHGAMGVTREYRLHHLSRRLWAWRHEHGTVKWWRRQLGVDVAKAGADALFPSIAR